MVTMSYKKTGSVIELTKKTSDKNPTWYAWIAKCDGFSVSIPYFVWDKLPKQLKVGDTCVFDVDENEQGYLNARKVDVVGFDPDATLDSSAIIKKRMEEKQTRIDEAMLQKRALSITEMCITFAKSSDEVIELYEEVLRKITPTKLDGMVV